MSGSHSDYAEKLKDFVAAYNAKHMFVIIISSNLKIQDFVNKYFFGLKNSSMNS